MMPLFKQVPEYRGLEARCCQPLTCTSQQLFNVLSIMAAQVDGFMVGVP
jgi:hypothetical protein